MQGEVARKLLHLSSIWIPFFFYYLPRTAVLWFLVPLTLISLILDYGRYYSRAIDMFVQSLFGSIMRTHEQATGKKLLSGATYIFISATLTILIFPRNIAVAAFAMLIVCDAASALIGRRFGKHRIFDKSWEGTVTFAVFGCVVVLVTPKVYGRWEEYVIGFAAAIIGAAIELVSSKLRLDDNLSVPTAIGFTIWAGYWMLTRVNAGVFGDVLRLLAAS